ncbi:MAG: hypothetical protein KGZ58_10465 [Ignavibacteriales bacterium]|nr:hypothetical protein [Ignavibacteriales bacterium]
MIKFIYEFGLFIFCIAGISFGIQRYCFVDTISYSYLVFIGITFLGVLLLALVGREEEKKEPTNGSSSGTPSTPPTTNGEQPTQSISL